MNAAKNLTSLQSEFWHRRALSIAVGSMALSAPLAFAQTRLRPTPEQQLGPFYPVVKPFDQDADLTITAGRSGRPEGQVIHVMGRVLDVRGEPVAGAHIEIWQANRHGRYTHGSDRNTQPLDPNFEGFGLQTTDAQGRYHFKTIKPGGYPATPDWMRPAHIHFEVSDARNKLVTQMYFDGDPFNDKDRYLQASWNKDALIAKVLPPTKELEADSLLVPWDIVMPLHVSSA